MAGLGQFADDIICQQVVVFARSVGLCRDRTARVAGFPNALDQGNLRQQRQFLPFRQHFYTLFPNR